MGDPLAKNKTYSYPSFVAYKWLLWLVTRLPFQAQMWLGGMIGMLAYWGIRSRRRTTEQNIGACFPEYSATEQARLVRQSFRSMGRSLLETATALMSPVDRWQHRFQLQDKHHLEQALATGRPVLLLSGHFGSLDLFGGMLSAYTHMAVVQRPHDNPYLDQLISGSRSRFGHQPVDRRALRQMISVLRQGEVPLWIGPDQDLDRRASVFAPFFGIATATITSFAKLARMTDAIVIPMSCHRVGDQYIGRAFAPMAFSGDDQANAAQYNAWLESEIRRAPEQYLWQHRRFKTRPDGEPEFYR